MSCNEPEKNESKNILLNCDFDTAHNTIPFKKIKNSFFIPAFEKTIKEASKEIKSIADNKNKPGFYNTVEALDKSAKKLALVSNIFFNLNHAETSPELQKIAKKAATLLADFENDIYFNVKLFKRVKKIYDKRKKIELTNEQITLLEKTYLQFFKNGVELDKEKQSKLRDISKELAKLQLQFDENVLAETNNFILQIDNKDDLSGLPGSVIEEAKEEAKKRNIKGWVFTLDAPSYLAFMKYADNRKLRKKMFMAMGSRGYKNNQYCNLDIIKKIANLRLKKANLLGYSTHAELVLTDRMAENPDKVNKFLKKLVSAAKPVAIKETQDIKNLAKSEDKLSDIQYWDWSYYSEKLKKKKYDFNEEDLRPFFNLEYVKKGIFLLSEWLWGLTFKKNKKIQVYHSEVEPYEVYDADGSFLGVLYLDFFPREGKNDGAWMTNFREQEVCCGKDIRPHVSLVFNFNRPTESKPSLLTFSELTTFLHEFGHALHGLMSDVKYVSLSGTNVYRDFVELPSQIMENWAYEKEFLDTFARHYITGETIPDHIIEKIVAIRKFNSGYHTMRQAGFSFIDMAWHTIKTPIDEHPKEFEKKAKSVISLLPEPENILISPSFSHIFAGGYSAGYYGYKWAEVLDADAYKVFKENGIFDHKTANSFRENILSKGGAEHPMRLYKKFRGKEPSIKSMLIRDGLFIK